MQGWLLTACRQWERPVLLIGGLTLIYPGTMTDLMGLALLAVIALLQLARRRPRPADAGPDEPDMMNQASGTRREISERPPGHNTRSPQ